MALSVYPVVSFGLHATQVGSTTALQRREKRLGRPALGRVVSGGCMRWTHAVLSDPAGNSSDSLRSLV